MIGWILVFGVLLGGMIHDYLYGIKITDSFFSQMMGLFILASILLTIIE